MSPLLHRPLDNPPTLSFEGVYAVVGLNSEQLVNSEQIDYYLVSLCILYVHLWFIIRTF